MTTNEILIRTLIYLAAGVIAAPLAKKLGLGTVVGYILAGAIIGPGVLSLTGNVEEVHHVAEFGVVILLFLIGLEVQPALLWRMKSLIFGLGTAQMAVTSAVLTLIGLAFGLGLAAAWTTSLILAMSSTALVMSTLEEKGQQASPVGRACFGVLLFQDLSIIPLFLIVPMLSQHGSGHLTGPSGGWAGGLMMLGALVAVVAGARFAVRPVFRFIAATRSREIFTGAALLLVVAVAAIMTAVGLSPALGAFIAGVVLGETEFRREIESDIEPFRGLLLALFFMTVGAGLDLALVRSEAVSVVAIALGFMTAKWAVMYCMSRSFRFGAIEAVMISVLLCEGGEFAFVFVSFAGQYSILPEHLGRLLPASVAVSMLLSPLLIILVDKVIRRSIAAAASPADANTEFESGSAVIVAGFGRFGQIAGRLLQANGYRLSIMDTSLRQIDVLRRFNQRVNFGDATRLDLLRAAGAETAKILIVAIDDREQATKLTETARSAFPHLVILARAWDRRHAYALLDAGADHIEVETYESSLQLGREALTRLGYRGHRAHRAAAIFRMHDRALFKRNRPQKSDEGGFIQASLSAVEALAALLESDRERDRIQRGNDEEWSTRGIYAELTAPAQDRSAEGAGKLA